MAAFQDEDRSLPRYPGHLTVEEFVGDQIAQDPGKELALLAAIVAIAGLSLSLFVRRRRLWVKATAADGTGTLVQVAALAKNEGADLTEDVTGLAEHLGVLTAPDPTAPERNAT